MKKTFSLMLGACALALTTFTSCHDHDDVFDESSEMNSGTALAVEGAVEGLNTTRATDTAWETGDSIGLTSTDLATNVKYVTTGGNGKFSAADADVYFTDRSDHVFYAYYPYSSKVNENCWYFSVSDSANVAAQKRNDIMVASGTATASNPTLQLQFKHAMARLIINVKTSTEDGFDADDVFSDNCSAMIGSTITRCMLNVTSSTVLACGFKGDLYLVAPTDNRETHVRQYVVYLPPQSGCKFSLYFNRGTDAQQCYSVQLTDGAWVAGKSYIYDITAKRDRLDLSSASTITDWNSSVSSLNANLD
jgi:hypothetical protein